MKKLTNEKKVINALSESSGLKAGELHKRVKMPIKSLYAVIYKLVKAGVVVRKEGGALYLAEEAKVGMPEATTLVREDKRVAELLKRNDELRKDNSNLLEKWRETSIELFDTRAVVTYLESKLKEAYGNAGKQG